MNKRRNFFIIILCATLFVASIVFAGGEKEVEETPKPKVEQEWKGKEISILVLGNGPKGTQSGPYYYWKQEWERITGAKLNIVEVPYPDLHTKIFYDLISGIRQLDGYHTGAWFYGDFMSGDYLAPIDEFVNDTSGRFPKWYPETVVKPQDELYLWKGNRYGANQDNDTQIMYYRKDILGNKEYQKRFKDEYGYELPIPPKTWEEFYDVGEFFNGWDWNGDGEPDYGCSYPLARGLTGQFFFPAMAGAYTVMPGKMDRYHGVFWFDPETMEPLINDTGHVKALEMYVDLCTKLSPGEAKGWNLTEDWNIFLSGNVALKQSWLDLGALVQDENKSLIKGKIGAAPLPGSMEVWDREKSRWLKLEKPNFVSNVVGGTWHLVTSRFSKNPELVYHLMAFMASPEISLWNVTHGWTGFDAAKTTEFLPPYGTAKLEDYVKEGWNPEDVKAHLNATFEQYDSPTSLHYLRIRGADRYYDSLDVHISEAVNKMITPQEALNRVYKDWQKITNDLGREEQLSLYQESIGYKK